jgi:hypothetical protein
MANVSIVTNKGLDMITALLAASSHKYIHWGTGTTEAADTQTALVTPGSESRTSGTQTQQDTGGTTKDTYQVVGTITCATAAKAITEVGVFSASTAGDMLLRSNFSAINVEVGDSIEFTIRVTVNQA